jgi:hypothetical protein
MLIFMILFIGKDRDYHRRNDDRERSKFILKNSIFEYFVI